jgi:hypothetical protein
VLLDSEKELALGSGASTAAKISSFLLKGGLTSLRNGSKVWMDVMLVAALKVLPLASCGQSQRRKTTLR